MIQAADAFPGQSRLCRQGQRLAPGGARGNDQGRRLRAETARGLGHDAGGDRLLPVGRRRLRRAGDDPHRHAQRIRLRRGHHRGLQGPHHPRLPHRRRRRRPRARHHQGRRAEERAAVVDQSDAALHRQHDRRASRHADGVPPSRSVDRRGPGLRRKPHPQGDHRGRGHSARPRRALDDVVGQPGHGPGRRGHHPHLADRRQDEEAARPLAAGEGRQRQRAGQALHRQIHHQSGHRAWRLEAHRLGREGQARRSGAVVAGLLRRQAGHASSRAARSSPRRWAIPTPRSRRRSRCITGRCSAPSAGRAPRRRVVFVVEGRGEGRSRARSSASRSSSSRWRTPAARSPRRA